MAQRSPKQGTHPIAGDPRVRQPSTQLLKPNSWGTRSRLMLVEPTAKCVVGPNDGEPLLDPGRFIKRVGDRMPDDIKYEYRSVQAVRGLESRSIAKEQREGGWELVDQTHGTLRTTLKFRRVKPDTTLSKAWGVFRGLAPAKQRAVVAGMAILLLLAAVGIGTSAAKEKRDAKPTDSVALSETSAPSPPPSVTQATGQTSGSSPAPTVAEEADQIITPENNEEFAALLATTDTCGPSVADFAAKYHGRRIAFDGSITNLQQYEKYKTRYDILIGPGDAGPKTTAGPNFKYGNVNTIDLKFIGSSVPSSVSEGDTFRFVAEVGQYKPVQGCLFFLTPVSTTVR